MFDQLERWIRRLSVLLGLLVILAPTIGFLHSGKRARGRLVGQESVALSRPGVIALMLLYVGGGAALWRPLAEKQSDRFRQVTTFLGALLFFLGVSLYFWGYQTLGRMFAISSSAGARLYENHHLVREGPFAYLRHPMYLGVLLAACGGLLIHRTWAMLMYAVSSFVVIRRANWEEAALAQNFGSDWEVYCTQTPKWLPRSFVGSTDHS